MPEVSAIVPARNAATTLARTLGALAAQTLAPERYEVIVVDDASDDGTAAIAERAGVRVVRQAVQRGPAAARNAGVAAARAPVLAFTDADCEPAPGWLAAGLDALRDADLVTGRIAATPGVPVRAFDRTLRIDGPSPRFESANVIARRSVFDAVGGFRRLEGGPSVAEGHFGEDALFGWRARRAGARVAYAPDALVHHAVFPRGPRAYIAERRRLRYFPALVRAAPELRGALTLRLFLTPRSARFDLALASAAAAVLARRPWLALGAAPYVRRHLRTDRLWRRSVARHNAAELCADLVGLGALLWGSARARTPLL